MSYAEVARAAAQYEPAHGHAAEQATVCAAGKTAVPAAQIPVDGPIAQYAAVKLVGNVVQASGSTAPQLEKHDISSEGGNLRFDDYDEPEVATIGELDPSVTDHKRVLNRMQGVRRAMQKRIGRLEKAQQELEGQRQAVEYAKQLQVSKADAVKTAETDLLFYKELHSDLLKKYTALQQASEQQELYTKQTELQQSQLQTTQQAIWQAATTIRGLGHDPRLEAALAALESIFKEVQGQPTTQQPIQSALSPLVPAAGVALAPPAAPTVGPAEAAVCTAICSTCWSVACRCSSSGAAAAAAFRPAGMEVDQERGTKRSCWDATLPENPCDRQAGLGAILVDAAGEAVSPQSEEVVGVAQQPPQQPDLPARGREDGLSDPEEGIDSPPLEAMDGQQAREPTGSSTPPAQPSTVVQEASDPSGPPETCAKTNPSEDADREESKSSFAALVKAACSNRSYPY